MMTVSVSRPATLGQFFASGVWSCTPAIDSPTIDSNTLDLL